MTDAATTSADRSFWQRNQQTWAPWLFLAPGMLFFVFYVIYPVFQSFNLSLYEWDGLGAKEYVGLRNYEDLYYEFQDRDAFFTSLKNNVLWLFLYLLAIPAGLFIALFLNQTVTGIRLYKSLFFFQAIRRTQSMTRRLRHSRLDAGRKVLRRLTRCHFT